MRRTLPSLHVVLVMTVLAAAVAATALAGVAGPVDAPTAGAGAAGPGHAPAAAQADGPNPCVGTLKDRPDGTTLVSIQGARGGDKTTAMVVGIAPDGEVVGVHDASANGRWWAYDVDPMRDGNLLLSTTEPGITVVEELDPKTGEHVSVRRFPDVLDAHDVDRINGDELLVDDMSQDGDDRIFVYNLTREEVVWEYRFANHPEQFPKSGGDEYGGDWTHNNDVEQIRPGTFMVSVRNFDQVVAIDRSTKEVEWKLGADEDHDVLFRQHNPDYVEGANGTPTVLVADSRNDRVVEYAREDGEWTQTWVLEGGNLDEPRDADRLPNGNTLVVDRRGHRVVEVTPTGEVVWEFYAPFQPYDVERYNLPDESTGPTARQMEATGTYEMTGSAGFDTGEIEACHAFLTSQDGDGPLVPENATPPNGTPDGNWTTVDDRSGLFGGDGASTVALLVAGAVVAGLVGAAAWRRRQ